MWYRICNQQVELLILAKANAKKTTLLRVSELGLHVAIHAKPHQGEANKELIAYLAKLFKLPKKQIELQRGETSKRKLILLPLTSMVKQFLDDPGQFLSFNSKKES